MKLKAKDIIDYEKKLIKSKINIQKQIKIIDERFRDEIPDILKELIKTDVTGQINYNVSMEFEELRTELHLILEKFRK